MAAGQVDPREILKGVEALLGKDGELRSLEGVPKVFRWEDKTRPTLRVMFKCCRAACRPTHFSVLSFAPQPDEGVHQDGQQVYVSEHPAAHQVPRCAQQVRLAAWIRLLCVSASECGVAEIPSWKWGRIHADHMLWASCWWASLMIGVFCVRPGSSVWVATGCSTPGWPTPRPPTTLRCCSSSCSHCRSCPSRWTTSSRWVQPTGGSAASHCAAEPLFTASRVSPLLHQNNTAKLVKQLSKSADTEGAFSSKLLWHHRLARSRTDPSLVSHW